MALTGYEKRLEDYTKEVTESHKIPTLESFLK